jgi:hypothetical protein
VLLPSLDHLSSLRCIASTITLLTTQLTQPDNMSQPLQERRSERNREPRRPFADEQAYHRFQEEAEAEVQRAIREAAATIEASDSDEEELAYGEVTASDDDEKTPSNNENVAQWTEQLHDIHPPPCTTSPTVVLPRHRLSTELDFFQCFVDPVLIDNFVTNTNLYAVSRQAILHPGVRQLPGSLSPRRRCGGT